MDIIVDATADPYVLLLEKKIWFFTQEQPENSEVVPKNVHAHELDETVPFHIECHVGRWSIKELNAVLELGRSRIVQHWLDPINETAARLKAMEVGGEGVLLV